jgi:uncharacterized lipoprotein YmbA
LAVLAGCADKSDRFLIDPPAQAAVTRVRVATVEIRDVSLPGYAAAIEMGQQEASGALRTIPSTVWADDPVRAVTMALAHGLDAATTATVAAEPWPLQEPAQARIDVRVERMLAGVSGSFEFAGQYAVASPDGAIRERLVRFDIKVPMSARDPAAIATASGQAIAALAQDIARTLAR